MQTGFHWTVDGTRPFDELAKSSTGTFTFYVDARDRSGNLFNYTRLTALKNGCHQEAHVFRATVPINESALGSSTTVLEESPSIARERPLKAGLAYFGMMS